MIETLRNLSRRKLRTFLTVLGITVGILALTVMGAMSEKINLLVDGALRYYSTRIVVQPKGGVAGQILGPPLATSLTDRLKEQPGVDEAFPIVYLLYQSGDEEVSSATIGFPPLVIGVDARRFSYKGDGFPVVLSAGRHFTSEERQVAVVGVDMARTHNAGLGEVLTIRGRAYRVIGIVEKTLTVRDNLAFIPLMDAQEMLAANLPPPLNRDPYAVASEIEVYPKDIKRADEIAALINANVPGVHALAPKGVEKQFQQSLVIFNVIIIGSAVIALVVGGLSVINTMATAVSERTRDIGIKKAIGATNGDIAKEFLQESAVIGLLGSVFGLVLGIGLVLIINRITINQGVEVFQVTPRLAAAVLVFGVVLGVTAGLLPARAAARRRPVESLRAE
ncbi:MAG: hypothetical protein HW397_410 [Dehalococcoidia bacterium]|nr:hypothetical protein [Dehalococcoidia bacterium]